MSTPDKPRLSLRQAKIESVCSFILQHPAAKDFEVIEQMRCSRRTVAYARARLVEQGLLPAPRNRSVKKKPAEPPAPPLPDGTVPAAPTDSAPPSEESVLSPSPTVAGSSYNDQLVTPGTVAMLAAGETLDEDIESDVETQKRMTREAKKMAFDLKLHPQIRMDAMTLWTKLKDAARARDLGPGKPVTRADALARLKAMFTAVGIDLVIVAVVELWGMLAINKIIEFFGHKEPEHGESASTPAVDTADVPSAPAEHPVAADDEPEVRPEA